MSRRRAARPVCLVEPSAPAERVADERSARDRGFVLAWMALMMIVLLGFAGFSVDLGHWYLTASRTQNAADAAALGGVVFLPNDLAQAQLRAENLAEGNGYDDVTVVRGDRSNQLRVTVTTEVDNFFVSLFGIQTTRITRDAMAEFEGPVPMGSPENFLGNDPELGEIPDHWMNVASVRNNAVNGDRFHAGLCPGGAVLGACAPNPTTNPDYANNGYFFAVEVTDTSAPLRIQVFDPAFYEVGDRCEQNENGIFGAAADRATAEATLQAAAAADPDIPDDWYAEALTRYQPGNSREWCTGDWVAGASRGGNGPITTTYVVRSPDNTPWLDSDNPVASCAPMQFPGRDVTWMGQGGGIWGRLNPANGGDEWQVNPSPWRPTLANSFRRWVTVCEIANPVEGRYLLQIKTNSPLGAPLTNDSSVNTWGHNRYSVRAGIGDPGSSGFANGARVFANGRLPIYTNASGADTEFYLARVTPSATTRVLTVSLWDISDGGSAGSMRIVAPAESGITFTGCGFGKTGGTWTTNPGNCSFSFNQNALNGHLVQVTIPIPADYTCAESNPFGCWIKVQAPFTGTVNDTTTWSADIVGDPVRLVE